jgi:sec-independent protein translocase protein TatA
MMPGWKELLIILLVVLLVFGAKKLKTIGSDLGAAIRGFKKSMNDADTDEQLKQLKHGDDDADFGADEASRRNAGAKTGTDRNA